MLDGAEAITCRPADLLENELDKIVADVEALAKDKGFKLADNVIDDALSYALFPQVAEKFLENRGNPDAFEPVPTGNEVKVSSGPETYTINVDGKSYVVQVEEGGDISAVVPAGGSAPAATSAPAAAMPAGGGDPVAAPLAGTIFKVIVSAGQTVQEGDVLVILEAMKMETEVRAAKAGTVGSINVSVGDSVAVGDTLLTM